MIVYFDCFSGISGDMIVGAFLDAGVPVDWLKGELEKLPLSGYAIEVADVQRGGFGGKRFKVTVEVEEHERNLREISSIISESSLPEDVKKLGIKVFERLAEAEAKVHRVGVDEIHFHEVGAIDSIIDIVAASLSFSYLGIKEAYASEMPMSQGTVSCSHGILPLPAPAVVELLKGIPVYQSPVKEELVTPTGAAFLSVVCKGFGAVRPMTLKATGYGAGERENEGLPNLLRVMIGEDGTFPTPPNSLFNKEGVPAAGEFADESGLYPVNLEADSVIVIEANIDDMNPEIYGFVMDRLFDAGALDVSLVPVYMKKGRPGTTISVICETGKERTMADLLLRETSTIGVRFHRAERLKLQREPVEVQTRFGKVRVKVMKAPWGEKSQPEYDDCVKAAMENCVPVREVYYEATKEYERGRYE